MLGPLLGAADAVVNNGKSPAIGKPSLVVSKAYETGNSLEVQWLRRHTFISEGTGSIPGWRTKILKAMQCSQKNEKKKAEEYTFFSSAHGTFSRIGHVLGYKTSLNKFEKTEISSIFFIIMV